MTVLERLIRSAVDEAVYVVWGGPTQAAHALQVANATVHEVIARGHIRRRDTALEWEQATAKAGCCIPAAELLAVVPWQPQLRQRGGQMRPAAQGRLPVHVAPSRATIQFRFAAAAVPADLRAPGFADPDDPLYTPQRYIAEQRALIDQLAPKTVRKRKRARTRAQAISKRARRIAKRNRRGFAGAIPTSGTSAPCDSASFQASSSIRSSPIGSSQPDRLAAASMTSLAA